METANNEPELNFDRARYAEGDAKQPTPCAECGGPLGEEYWHLQGRAVCPACRARISNVLIASQSKAAFGKAALLGGLTALACGIAYAVFVAVTDYQLALLTIGIAFLVARVIRGASAGVGGRKYQLLAVGLTYVASTMGYAPGVFNAVSGSTSSEVSAKTGGGLVKPGKAQSTVERDAPRDSPPSPGEFVLAIVWIFAITLAAPILAATEAPMGLLIVGFGLWEAWRLTRGIPLTLDGPYRAAPLATGPPAP